MNELWALTRALKRAGITVPERHPRVKTPGRTSGPMFRVVLNDAGRVARLEMIADEERPGLWTTMEGQMNSFPVVRVDMVPTGWTENHTKLLATLAKNKAPELREAAHSDTLAPVAEVYRRFALAASTAELLELLRDDLATAARAGLDEQLLDQTTENVFRLDPSAASQKATRVQLAFDGEAGTIYRQDVRTAVEAALPVAAKSTGPARTRSALAAGRCAFSGAGDLHTNSYPKVRLPVLNDVPLASMSDEAQCNTRYRLTGSSIVPVSTAAALAMQDALTWVVADEREGRTWRPVANGKFETGGGKREQEDLLIAFVDGEPDIAAPIADLFGTGPAEITKQFEVDAEAVCNALNGVAQRVPESRLNLFVIRRASRGQAHIDIAAEWKVAEVIDAARRWHEAGRNRPPLRPLPGVPEKRCLYPTAPYPGQVLSLMSWQWVQGGERQVPYRGARLRDVLDVMLRKEGVWEPAARHLLSMAVTRIAPAVEAVATKEDSRGTAASRIVLAANTLAVLLGALGRTKEVYMHTAPFLVGRLLSTADTLHRQYCKVVRGKDGVPPQLIGNALLGVARNNPTAAVDRLGDRIHVYQRWATQTAGEESGLAKWSLAELGRISRDLETLTLPSKTNELDRAELLLGYLYRPEPANQTDAPKGEEDGNHH